MQCLCVPCNVNLASSPQMVLASWGAVYYLYIHLCCQGRPKAAASATCLGNWYFKAWSSWLTCPASPPIQQSINKKQTLTQDEMNTWAILRQHGLLSEIRPWGRMESVCWCVQTSCCLTKSHLGTHDTPYASASCQLLSSYKFWRRFWASFVIRNHSRNRDLW